MFNKAIIAAATAAFISATAAPVTQAEAGSLNFSISFGKKSFKKSFKRKSFKRRASLRRGNTNRRRANTNRRSRKATRPASRKCASGLKIKGVCQSMRTYRKLEAIQKDKRRKLAAIKKKSQKDRRYVEGVKRCRDQANAKHTNERRIYIAMMRCMQRL